MTSWCLIASTGRHLSEQSKQGEREREREREREQRQTTVTQIRNWIWKKKSQRNFRICNKIGHELIYVTGLLHLFTFEVLKSSVIFPKFDQLRAENYNISQPEQNLIQTIQKILNIQ